MTTRPRNERAAIPLAANITRPKILIIRHGALGDFILSLGPFAAIRARHDDAHLTLLTSSPFLALAAQTGYFDDIWCDDRPPWWHYFKVRRLMKQLRTAGFDRVYDLQTSSRTARYWKLMGKPDWNGHVTGCRWPDADPTRNQKHTVDRQRSQLAAAGIADVSAADVSWLSADVTHLKVPKPYALLVPGGAAHRPEKRWPAAHYDALCQNLTDKGVTPVLIGADAEAPVLTDIADGNQAVLNLCGKTSFQEIATLARGAVCAIGNDTGPMHLIAAAGCPSLVLFSKASDPALCAPCAGAAGGRVAILRRPDLATLTPEAVAAKLPSLCGDLS